VFPFIPFIVVAGFGASLIVAGVVVVLLVRVEMRKARESGYPTLLAYLRAAPRTDAEKRDAIDLALKGLVLCLLGTMFPPLLLFVLFPFFYGARKVA